MKLITIEKLELLKEHSGHILTKPDEQRTAAERDWPKWSAKRIKELEAAES
jgi:hypothetical protein